MYDTGEKFLHSQQLDCARRVARAEGGNNVKFKVEWVENYLCVTIDPNYNILEEAPFTNSYIPQESA